MPEVDISKAYQQARQHWPEVDWDRQSYEAHVAEGERPVYPMDLYLAGAAGHRIDAAWITIENEQGPKAKKVLQRQPIADMTVDDLWSETITRLMENDTDRARLANGRLPARIIRYRGLVKLLNYLITIARRFAIQRNRKRRPRLSLSVSGEDRSQADYQDTASPDPSEAVEQAEIAREMQTALGQAYNQLSAEQQFLIAMVYRQGMKQKKAGALLGWSEFKTCRQLAQAQRSLREGLKDLEGLDWSAALTAAWSGAWSECWKNVQGANAQASGTETQGTI